MRWKRYCLSGALIESGVFLLCALVAVVFTVAVLSGDEAYGQDQPAQPAEVYATPDMAQGRARGIVRVKNSFCEMTPQGRQCTEAFGSGAIIGRTTDDAQFVVLSCAHTFRERGRTQIEVAHRTWRDAMIRAIDHRVDLSLLIVPVVEPIPGIPIAETVPTTADPLITRGYPSASMYIERPTKVIGSSGHLWTVDCRPIQGESGGCLLSPAGVVGVLVLTEGEDPGDSQFNPGGHAVGLPTIRQFVNATFPNQRQTGSQPYQRGRDPNDRGPIPLAPAPPPPVQQAAPQALPAKEDAKAEPEAPDVSWSRAKAVILVPRQPQFDKADGIVRRLEQMSSQEVGPGAVLRRIINEHTEGKLDVEIVYERIEPTRFREIVVGAGILPEGYLHAVALIRKQDAGLLGPLKSLASHIAKRAIDSNLGNVPLEVVFERTNPKEFTAVEFALKKPEPEPAKEPATQPTTPTEASKGVVDQINEGGPLAWVIATVPGAGWLAWRLRQLLKRSET